MKKLKEERQIEELKKLQVSAGLIPEAHLQRLDWMYQGPECTSDITTAEEYLLGKPIKDTKPEEKKHFTPVFQESYSNPQNEVFTKIHEDPLFSIKKEEFNKRKEIEENPYKMKLLLKEVERNIKKRKKEKKTKKHKKDKKKKKHRGDSSSSSNTEERFKTPELDRLRIITPSLLNNNFVTSTPNSSFGLTDKNGNRINPSSSSNRRISDIKPDEKLYRERLTMLEKESELRRKKYSNTKDLTKEEREQRITEMEKKAQILDYQKTLQIEERNLKHKYENEIKQRRSEFQKPDFIKYFKFKL